MSRAWVLLFLAVWIAAAPGEASTPADPYQEIRVRFAPGENLDGFLRSQIPRNPDLELTGLGEEDARFVSRPEITADLVAQGYSVEVVHPDLQAYYAARQGKVADYGVWHTYAEMLGELESLHGEFPEITTAPFSIGRSLEGREIWAIKVSDNPDQNEAEPEVLFDGNHHAREIMTEELCLYLIRYLCENYRTDRLATGLVDQRQIYFVPIVNPDGFVYNETIAPNGGGMWRKNRRPGFSCAGVDLNRNYPIGWGGAGSSGNGCDETYRGPSAASEPETQTMMRFMNGHRFVTHDSIHSFMGAILYPWGYTGMPTPDENLLWSIATDRASENGYSVARIGVSGCASDFAYGEQTTRPKIMSFLTEIGGSGFWPDPSEKEGLLRENLHSMLFLAQAAGPSLNTESLVVLLSQDDPQIEPGETIELVGRIVNGGRLGDPPRVHARLRCDDPYVRLLAASDSVDGLPPGAAWENADRPFSCRIEEECPQGRIVTFTVSVDADGSFNSETPFVFQVGSVPALYGQDFEDGSGGWRIDTSQTTNEGAFVRIDPNRTPFQPGDDTTPQPGVFALVTGQNETDSEGDVDGGIVATRSRDYDLSGLSRVRLSMNYFFGQRDGGDDPAGDWFRIEVSSDGGTSWIQLVGIGDQRSLPEWRNLTVDLEGVIGLTDRVRFRVQASDGPDESDIIEAGIDDFRLMDPGTDSEPPGRPDAVAPADGTSTPPRPTFVVRNVDDPEADPLRYGFRIFADPEETEFVLAADGVAEGSGGTTSWTASIPLERGTYYWRSFAADAQQRGIYGAASSFVVDSAVPIEDLEAVHAEPNPSRGSFRILYFLPRVLTSRVSVYDAQGREVRRLANIPSASGWQVVEWNTRDDDGRRVPSGSYWVRVWTPEETRTVRVVRVE